jgi:Ser/Thr protein kinase RdoA (MazF antagonist)
VERGERIQSLWSGYGELYRARLDGVPVVVKEVRPPNEDSVSHRRKVRSYEVELEFYRTYAPRSAARVAKLIRGVPGLLVLEDLDAAGYPRRRVRDIDVCLAWLADFHRSFLNVAPIGLWEQGTYWHLSTRQEELLATSDPALREAAPILDARLRAAKHKTLVHGDAKLANFCFGDAGVAAVDFQYVGAGCGMSDVAYFLSCFDAVDSAAHLDTYFRYLDAAGELEREWRALYPIAVLDFYRFYAGWSPGGYANDRAGQRFVRAHLAKL